MFTGIVQGIAHIASINDHAEIRAFEIAFPDGFAGGLEVGGSVAIDGVCLTATKLLSPNLVSFDVILQSLQVTTLSELAVGAAVNVERAAKDGAEIGGHPLSGHVDFSTVIAAVREAGGNKVLRVQIPEAFRRYIFPKGYIAVNGASLTVAECNKLEGWIEIWLIPETRRATNLDSKAAGDRINIEIERGTQVVVDTVRDAISEVLGDLKPTLERILAERHLNLEDLITSPLALARSQPETNGQEQ